MLPLDAIEAAADLVGADLFGVAEADNTGYAIRLTLYPDPGPQDPQVCDGPLPTGLVHDATQPDEDRASPMLGLRDIVWLGCATITAVRDELEALRDHEGLRVRGGGHPGRGPGTGRSVVRREVYRSIARMISGRS
jgi:hypothetical protein